MMMACCVTVNVYLCLAFPVGSMAVRGDPRTMILTSVLVWHMSRIGLEIVDAIMCGRVDIVAIRR